MDRNRRLAELLGMGWRELPKSPGWYRYDLLPHTPWSACEQQIDDIITYQPFRPSTDAKACLWAWERVLGDARWNGGHATNATSCWGNISGHNWHITGNGIRAEGWSDESELAARVDCMIAALKALAEGGEKA